MDIIASVTKNICFEIAESIAVFKHVRARLIFEIFTVENVLFINSSQIACKFVILYTDICEFHLLPFGKNPNHIFHRQIMEKYKKIASSNTVL